MLLTNKDKRPDLNRGVWFPVAKILPAKAPKFSLYPSDKEVERAIRSLPCHYSSFGTNTWPELYFANKAAFSAVTNTLSETTLLGGANLQPTLSPPTFAAVPGAAARCISFKGWGLLSNTGTPTLTFKFYLNPTQGSASLAGTTIGASAAITTASGVTSKIWKFELDLICQTPGQGTGNCTLFASGTISSPAGFASPFSYAITPGGGDSATVTATLDGSLTQFFNMSATWSAASASNSITLQALEAFGWN